MAARTLAALALALGFAGCAQIPGAPPVVAECTLPADGNRTGPALVGQSYGMQMTPVPLDSVQFDSQESAGAVAIQQLFANRTTADTVRVSARLLGCADRPASIQVRTSFLRGDMSPAEAPSAWKTVHLPARGFAVYEELSTAQDVAHYLIEISR